MTLSFHPVYHLAMPHGSTVFPVHVVLPMGMNYQDALAFLFPRTMPLGNFVMAGGTASILQVHHIDVTLVLGDREIEAVRTDGEGAPQNAKR